VRNVRLAGRPSLGRVMKTRALILSVIAAATVFLFFWRVQRPIGVQASPVTPSRIEPSPVTPSRIEPSRIESPTAKGRPLPSVLVPPPSVSVSIRMRHDFRKITHQQDLAAVDEVAPAMRFDQSKISTLKRWEDAAFNASNDLDSGAPSDIDPGLRKIYTAKRFAEVQLLGAADYNRYQRLLAAVKNGDLEAELAREGKPPAPGLITTSDRSIPDTGPNPYVDRFR
jgi:hypothetical protein